MRRSGSGGRSWSRRGGQQNFHSNPLWLQNSSFVGHTLAPAMGFVVGQNLPTSMGLVGQTSSPSRAMVGQTSSPSRAMVGQTSSPSRAMVGQTSSPSRGGMPRSSGMPSRSLPVSVSRYHHPNQDPRQSSKPESPIATLLRSEFFQSTDMEGEHWNQVIGDVMNNSTSPNITASVVNVLDLGNGVQLSSSGHLSPTGSAVAADIVTKTRLTDLFYHPMRSSSWDCCTDLQTTMEIQQFGKLLEARMGFNPWKDSTAPGGRYQPATRFHNITK